ncbi:MAG: hypothetical protein GX303_05660, partial [Clostridiales bacterium]|nr:hypothetical protein [Clostridiales bacterium]
ADLVSAADLFPAADLVSAADLFPAADLVSAAVFSLDDSLFSVSGERAFRPGGVVLCLPSGAFTLPCESLFGTGVFGSPCRFARAFP